MSRLVAWLVVVVGLLVTRVAGAAVAVDLYTIGPSSEFPSRFGHSLLCVRPSEQDVAEQGRCFDYGIPDRDDIAHIVWTSVRNQPSFVPMMIAEPQMLAFFKDQGRKVERQRLPLSADEADGLVRVVEDDVRARRAYAYHPYHANCATKIRDVIDAASHGKLRPGPTQVPPGGYRDYMEEGHSGRVGILTAMALYLGESNDRVPSPWEAMLLPAVLRDGVAERFGVRPEQVSEPLQVVLPTSRAVGRIALFALAFALFLAVRLCARKNRLALALKIVGGTLGVIAVSLEVAAALVAWPEIARNWALLLLLPSDLALPYLGKRLTLYLKVRMAMAVVFVGLEVANIVHQPMLPLAALVVFPMSAILTALRAVSPAASPRLSRTSEVTGDA